MTLDEYIKEAVQTDFSDLSPLTERLSREMNLRLLHGAIGASTEANEILDDMKKHVFYGKTLDNEHIIEEIGDCLWYLAIMCNELGVSFAEVADRNIAKLRLRYGTNFSEHKAINREES